MEYEIKEGYFNAFKNNFKEKENQPDFTGVGRWKGELIEISIWKKTTQKDDVYCSGQIQEPYEKRKREEGSSFTGKSGFEDIGDDIPF